MGDFLVIEHVFFCSYFVPHYIPSKFSTLLHYHTSGYVTRCICYISPYICNLYIMIYMIYSPVMKRGNGKSPIYSGFSINSSIYRGFPVAMFDYRRVWWQYIPGWWFGTFFIFPFSWECHNPSWRTHIFQRGGSTTNQIQYCSLPSGKLT